MRRKSKAEIRPNYPHGRMPMDGYVIIDGVYISHEEAKLEAKFCCIWKERGLSCSCTPPTERQRKAIKALKEQVK